MAGAKFGLDNLCAVIDRNRLQISGSTEDVMPEDPLEDRWAAFGWNVLSVDGTSIDALDAAFETAKTVKGTPTVPTAEEYMKIKADFLRGKEAAQHAQ